MKKHEFMFGIWCIVLSFVLVYCFLPKDVSTEIAEFQVFIPVTTATLNITAVPEKRIPNIPNIGDDNLDSHVVIEIYNTGANRIPANILASTTVDTDDDGVTTSIKFDGLAFGTYDITAKGFSHLRTVSSSVDLTSGVATVDFTDDSNDPLLSGDVNLENGDNKINAIDVSLLVNKWGTNDERMDLNQDLEVNSLDISNLITNFLKTGD